VLVHKPFLAVGLLISAQWVLSILDTSGKWLATSAGLSVVFIAFVRYAVHLMLGIAWTLPSQGLRVWHSNQITLQIVRGLLMLATTLLFFSVLRIVPLAQATAMNFIAPVMVVALAPWVLNEPARVSRWFGVIVAFVGTLIVVRPSGAVPANGLALGIACATCFAGFQIVTRRLRADSEHATNLYSGAVGTIFCALALPWSAVTYPNDPWTWAVLISTGFTGFLGHMLQIAAYRRAEASFLSPFVYLQIFSAAALGFLIFHQWPDVISAWGMALIVAAGVLVAWHGKRNPIAAAQ
jgi:drug/metabolite transporter (DMT)-like permease